MTRKTLLSSLLLFAVLALPSFVIAATAPADKEQATAAATKFIKSLAQPNLTTTSINSSLDDFFDTKNRSIPPNIEQIRDIFVQMAAKIGPPQSEIPFEQLLVEQFSSLNWRFVYVINYELLPITLDFTLYKSKGKWVGLDLAPADPRMIMPQIKNEKPHGKQGCGNGTCCGKKLATDVAPDSAPVMAQTPPCGCSAKEGVKP